MRVGKFVAGSAAVGALAVGGILLLKAGSGAPGDAERMAEEIAREGGLRDEGGGGEVVTGSAGLELLSEDESSIPLLVIGENDVRIDGYLSEDGWGRFTSDVGTGGMTFADLPNVRQTRGARSRQEADHDAMARIEAIAARDQSAGGGADDNFLDTRLEVELAFWRDEDWQAGRDLGSVRVRAFGEGLRELVIGDFDRFAVFSGPGSTKLVLLDATVGGAGTGKVTVEGVTESGELRRYLEALEKAGRLEEKDDADDLQVSGIDVTVYGSNPEEPVEFGPKETSGTIRGRRYGKRSYADWPKVRYEFNTLADYELSRANPPTGEQ